MKHLPNAVTLLNLLFGCFALLHIVYGQFIEASWWLFCCLVADFLDGFLARWLKVQSKLGKELDSLADLVSFGVVPGTALYMLLVKGMGFQPPFQEVVPEALPAFLLTVASGLRLGMFNIDDRQEEHFLGLPTPASTILVIGLLLIDVNNSFGWQSIIRNPYFLYPLVLGLSVLLIVELPMFSFKIKKWTWAGNEIKVIFVALSTGLLIYFQEASFSLIVLLYLILNLGSYFLQQKPAT